MKAFASKFGKAMSAALFVLLLVAAGPKNALAQSFTVGNLNYSVNDDGVSVTVTGHVDGTAATGELVIPESVEYYGNNYTVTAIDNYAFMNCFGLTGSLTIPNSVTTIGNYAFYGCSGFTGSLPIGNSVTTIGFGAFNGCSGFTGSLTISNSVTTIGNYAFQNCSGFTGSLTMGSSVTTIGVGAFNGCSGFTGSLTMGNSVTTIGDGAFEGCNGFTGDLTIPNSVTTIGVGAFNGCSGFTGSLTMGNSVTTIGNYAFYGCSGFTGSLTMGNSVTTIGNNAFANIGFNGTLTIPESVTYIGRNTFENTGFTTVNFNATNCVQMGNYGYDENMNWVWMSSFRNCPFLTSLNIGNNVQTIPYEAFDGLSNLSGALVIPNSVTSIGGSAFANCTGLTGTLTIPESVTTIGDLAFANCIGLTGTLTIPESVTSIGDRALAATNFSTVNFNATSCTFMGSNYNPVFADCNNLTTLNIGENVEVIPRCAFSGCTGFEGSLVIPESVISIGGYAFNGCTGLTGELTIGSAVESIGEYVFNNTGFSILNYNARDCQLGYYYPYENIWRPAFYNIPLTTLNIGEGVESLSNRAFRDLNTFTGTLTLPNSLTTIGEQAFYNCYGLEGIEMGNSVETIGAEAFRNCGGLRGELTLPETLQSVGNYAFASCDELTTINYNAINCTEMGNAQSPVFYDCASVAHINIGENVESIPNYAFKRCSTVTDMTVGAAVPPTIGASTFGTVSRSIPVTVPYGSGEAYHLAQYWEEFFNIVEGYGPIPYTNYWHANPHQFAFNMSVIGIIQIDGVEQVNQALEIGAFCGNECRGSQMLTYYPQIDRHLLFLTLYGEEGDLLTFRLYDHEAGEISTLACSTYITFTPNGILGTYQNPYVFDFRSIQNAELPTGWTWYSSYVNLDGVDGVQMMMEGLGENGLIIKSQSDGFVAYDEGEWVGTLTSVNNESAYFISTSASCVMSMEGGFVTPDQHPITLSSGWNWIGYPSVYASEVNMALETLASADGDVIKSQNDFSIYSDGYGWIGEFNTITPGMGMMYNSLNSQPVTLVYSVGGRNAGLTENTNSEHYRWTANRHAFPYNMSILAVVQLEGNELHSPDVELAAFAADECRGSARLFYVEPLNRYMAFLTVSGEGDSQLTWRLYDSSTGMEYANTKDLLQFNADGIIGSLESPLVVNFSTSTATDETFGSLISLYPNPVKAGNKVRVNMPCDSKARLEVVNALGAVVSTETLTGLNETIQVPNTSGVYVVRITVEGQGTFAYRLIVE